MGAVIGSSDFKKSYVSNKIQKWTDDVLELTKIAKDEPQAVYSCFTKAIAHRWSYVQRTIPGIDRLFIPLEEVIRERLIPAIVGRKVSDIERRILALPIRHGGMGIANPTKTSEHEHDASLRITNNLTQIIYNQEEDFSNYNQEEVNEEIKKIKAEKEERFKKEYEEIVENLDAKSRRILDLARESGAGSWLNAIPI